MHKTASLLLIMTSSQICEWWTGLCYLEGSVSTDGEAFGNSYKRFSNGFIVGVRLRDDR